MLGSDLGTDKGNQDDNTEWEAEGGMSTCKCQLESHSANSVQNQTWKPVYYSRSCQLGYLNCSPHPSMLNIGYISAADQLSVFVPNFFYLVFSVCTKTEN